MTFDYDKLYGETPDALGPPTQVFVDFFASYDHPAGRVLDVGCGQGRDALHVARRGHRVVGVDISSNGIADLRAAAQAESLAIEGLVADLTDFMPDGLFDVILIDRTLHMLTRPDRERVLARLLDHVAGAGWILIADERRNIGDMAAIIAAHGSGWVTRTRKGGTLFAQRT